MCSCNHLTEFAVLAREAECGVEYSDEEKVYSAFAIIYAVIIVLSLIQLLRIIWFTRRKCKLDLLSAEHICVLVVAIFRAIILFIRSRTYVVKLYIYITLTHSHITLTSNNSSIRPYDHTLDPLFS
jgi:hypothetical protein